MSQSGRTKCAKNCASGWKDLRPRRGDAIAVKLQTNERDVLGVMKLLDGTGVTNIAYKQVAL